MSGLDVVRSNVGKLQRFLRDPSVIDAGAAPSDSSLFAISAPPASSCLVCFGWLLLLLLVS
jgi:hypothetical protein